MKAALLTMSLAFSCGSAGLIVWRAGWLVLLGCIVLNFCAEILVKAAQGVKS